MTRARPARGSSVGLHLPDPVLALPDEDEEPWEDEEEDEDEEDDEDEEEDEEPGWLVAGQRPAAQTGIGLASPC